MAPYHDEALRISQVVDSQLPQEIVRQALPPLPGVLQRLIDTWKRIVALPAPRH